MKFLRNPAWLAVILAVLVAPVPIVLYLKARPVKKLRVEVLSNSPLFPINPAVTKEMEVRYKGQPVHTLSLILLKFANTGTEPIKESDYSEPIRVLMSQSAKVGEASVQETRPAGIRLNPTFTRNQVELAPVLLNPGDQAVIKVVALNNDSTLNISARIVGIRTLDIQSVLGPNETKAGDLYVPIAYLYVLFAFVVLCLLGYLIWWSRPVIEWRKKRLGFDPPRYYYALAQSGMLTLLASKTAQAPLAEVIRNLDKCFSWDYVTYMAKVTKDPLFAQLLGYERFKDVVEKHTGKQS